MQIARPPDVETALRRSEELDALDAILPLNRRDQLAAILTDDDIATLKHLATAGMRQNTMVAEGGDSPCPHLPCISAAPDRRC